MSDTARHFIMYDDPQWFFAQIDGFSRNEKPQYIAYWLCQILGWGAWAAFGVWMAATYVGLRATLVAGYGIFFVVIVILDPHLASSGDP